MRDAKPTLVELIEELSAYVDVHARLRFCAELLYPRPPANDNGPSIEMRAEAVRQVLRSLVGEIAAAEARLAPKPSLFFARRRGRSSRDRRSAARRRA